MSSAIHKKYNLPDRVRVRVKRTVSGGYYAYLIGYPGCISSAPDLSKLIANVNDAILTYFEVPRAEAIKFEGAFVPHNTVPKTPKKVRDIDFRSYSPNLSYA